jgi:hypothetical protein
VPDPRVQKRRVRDDDAAACRAAIHAGFVRLQRCYESAARSDPRLFPIIAKAQWLIDALPSDR